MNHLLLTTMLLGLLSCSDRRNSYVPPSMHVTSMVSEPVPEDDSCKPGTCTSKKEWILGECKTDCDKCRPPEKADPNAGEKIVSCECVCRD